MRSGVAAKLFAACLCGSLADLAVLDLVVGPAALQEEATRTDAPSARSEDTTDAHVAHLSTEATATSTAPATSPSASDTGLRGSAPTAASRRRVVARFDSDQPAADDTELRALAASMIADPSAEIVLEGHADQRGDPERNRMLSLERAKWAQAKLVELGVSSSRIAVVGVGAERPRDLGEADAAIASNRRVEVRWITGTPPSQDGDSK